MMHFALLRLLVALWAVVCLLTQWALADLTIRGYTPALHNRFLDASSFIGHPYDWSGVARSNTGRWATMVSANFFISATHFRPGIGDTLTLYGGNSVSGPKQVVNVVGGMQIAGSDIWLGWTDAPTPFGTFEVAAFDDPLGYLNQEIFVWGVASNTPEITAQMKLGRNTVDAILPAFSHPNLGSAVTDVFLFDYTTPTGGAGDDEALVQPGDSGAPSFLNILGRPVLLGVHWFKYSMDVDGMTREGSGDSLIGSYVHQINAAMIDQQLRLVSAAEPSSLLLIALPVIYWRARRVRLVAQAD